MVHKPWIQKHTRFLYSTWMRSPRKLQTSKMKIGTYRKDCSKLKSKSFSLQHGNRIRIQSSLRGLKLTGSSKDYSMIQMMQNSMNSYSFSNKVTLPMKRESLKWQVGHPWENSKIVSETILSWFKTSWTSTWTNNNL
jgi:hypothetical protein